ncbi:TonB-dependent receptor [Sphingomonas faeni]|uniref:TonB-dependent receptor n=1 Tax=Sphingomonas faeni TaxID=185950 RepID=UPI003354AFA6
MNTKARLCASVAAITLATVTPATAQTSDNSTVKTKVGGQDLPKPTTASDQNANPAAPQPSLQESPAEGDGEIVVTGLRRSLESAQAIKRNSDGIVDAIVAEDIGKLPDTFASSALARVSGVQVTRGGGESAGVTVRGLPDLSTTYNGREIFTAEGRFVQIQDFPAGTVAALEVYKSGTANLIEGGIGGQVNVRGRRPFDFNGFEVSGSANGVAWEQSGKTSWNGNLLISDRWDTGIGEMGLLLNGSFVGIDFLDSTREQSLVIGTTSAAQGTAPGIRYPDAQGLFYGGGHRWRPSANAAFQWKPTPELEIYADGLFQGFRSEDTNRYMFVPIFGDIRLSNVVTNPDHPSQAQSFTVSNAVAPDGYSGSFHGKTDTYQAGGGAIWKHDKLQISADIAYTDSKYTADLVNIDNTFASSPVRNVSFDAGKDGGPSFDFVNFDVTNPANFLSRGFYQELLVVSGKDVQTRADVQYDVGEGFLRRIQFGVRYNDRDATRDRGTDYRYNLPAGIPLSSVPVGLESTNAGFNYNSVFPVRTFVAASSDSVRQNLPQLRTFYGAPAGTPVFNPTENFVANEKAYAAYGQVKYGFDLGSITVDGLVGVRAIKTKTQIAGFNRVLTANSESFVPTTQAKDYTDYLPNVSARVGLSDELQLRLAYTQTRTRPNFLSLNPTLTIDPLRSDNTPIVNNNGTITQTYRTANGGNPNLTPLTSNNYDASLEYYFSRSGSLTGAIFRRDAQGFIFNSLTLVTDPVYGLLQINQPVNSGNTRFQGAEVSFSSFLDIDGLPDWAKGFGLQANGTYVDSKGDLSPDFNRLLGNRRVPFNGVSKWTYNVVALYERPFFSARLAYNYRSRFVSFYSQENLDVDPANVADRRVRGTYEKGRGQLDFSTTVTPIPSVTLAFDIVNLLGNPLQRERQYDDAGDTYARQIIYLERTYSLGVRFRF